MNHKKNRRKGNTERFLSILLAAVMMLSLISESAPALTAYAQESIMDESAEEKPAKEDITENPAEENIVEKPSEEDIPEKPEEENITEKPSEEDITEKSTEENITENPSDENAAEENKTEDSTEDNIPKETTPEENKTEETDEDLPAEGTDAEEGLCPHHEQHTEDCGYGETTSCGYECHICPVQELIDALPDADEITAENAADVEKQLAGIDEAKAELTDEELDALDTTKYEAAVSALLALEDMEGADKIQALESTGAFNVTGGMSGTDYTYADGVLTIKSGTQLTISGTSTSDCIEVEKDVSANITLNNVSIEMNSSPWNRAAFKIADNSTGDVTVTLVGENTLKSSTNCAGLQKYGADDNVGTLTITGKGSLTAIGGDYGAGIGGGGQGQGNNNSTRNITINGGTIKANGSSSGAGIGGGDQGNANAIIIQGTANVTATGTTGAGIGGGQGGIGSIIITDNAHVTAIGKGGAGIGGGQENSYSSIFNGDVTISGNAHVTATSYSGAGIGGGQSSNGTVTISGNCDVTATATNGGAGIGGGIGGNGTVTISGGTVNATGKGNGAGIGGGSGSIGSGGNGTVKITGGNITATGNSTWSAGIGGGKGNRGGTVTISGGTVTATGKNGIGNGGGTPSSDCTFFTGTGGDAWIVASSISDTTNQDSWNGIIFQGNAGQVYGNYYALKRDGEIPSGATLTVPDNTILAIGQGVTLTNGGTITNNDGTITIQRGGSITGGIIGGTGTFQTENLTEDDIVAPSDLIYNGENQTEEIRTVLANLTATICGQAFTLTGWNGPEVSTTDNFNYTIAYTPTGGGTKITKTVKLGQSDTQFVGDGVVKAYNGDTAASEFTYGETITVKAIPTATGRTPAAARSRARTLTAPTAGQMAVYCGGKQVSDAVSKDANGSYTMTVSVKDIIAAGAEYGSVTLTAKFVGNDYMAGASGEVDVTLKPATLTITSVTLDAKTYDGTNTGTVNEVTFSGVVDGDSLSMGEDGDYTATADFADENAGTGKTAIVTVTLTNGNYTFADGTKKATYTLNGQTISPKLLNADNVAVAVEGQYEYNDGEAIIPAADKVTVTYKDDGGEEVTIPGDEYTFTCSDNTEVGTATLTLSDAEGGNYNVSGSGTFEIIKPSLDKAEVTLSQTSYTYDGTEKTPTVTVRKGDAIVAASEYTISYSNTNGGNDNHTNAGTVTVTITAKEDGHYSGSKSAEFTISQALLPAITLDTENVTYNGNEQKPTVTANGLTEGTDYEISYTRGGTVTSDFTNAGEITVTVTGTGNYTGTATAKFIIAKATPQIAWSSTSQELYYTGKAAEITAPTVTLVNGETFSGTISYSDAESGTSYAVLPAEAGTYKIKAGIAASGNYTAAETADMLTLTIKYYDGEIPVKFTANGNELTEAAWVTPATQVTISASGFAIAAAASGGTRPAADEITESYITMSASDVAKMTFYFKQTGTGYMTDGIKYELNIDDNPPGGSIKLNYKFWDRFLSAISFGHYQATEKAVTITAADNESGIKTTQYVIVTGGTSYASKDELEAANLSWLTYSSGNKPIVDVNIQSVIYAKLTDNAGNVTYLSSDGILLDTEAPAISGFAIAADSVTDEQAQMSITVNETATVYLVTVPTAKSGGIQAKDVIATCAAGAIGSDDGTVITEAAWRDILAADGENLTGIREIKGLAPNTEYTVYAVAVDKVIDMDKTESDRKPIYTGNVSSLSSISFTTKKTLPKLAKSPAVSGTYGQTIGDMLTPGTAKGKDGAVLEGTWTVSESDRSQKPSVGTTEEITVTFTPNNAAYDTISVAVTPKVNPRSLQAADVIVTQVQGTYTYNEGAEIKPLVSQGTGTPAEGIYISDSRAELKESDFTVSYSNNINAEVNKAAVTITGKGNYTGSVTRTFTIEKAPGRTVPDLTGSHTNDGKTYIYTIKPTEGAVYRKGDDGTWTKENEFKNITPGTEVEFFARIPGDANHEDGTAKSITVTFEKLTPAAPVLAYTYKTDKETGKVTVIITKVTGAQYSFDGGTTWGDANEQDGFNSSQTVTLAIRLKGTDTHKESPVQKVTVDLAKKDRKAPDSFKLKYEANGETDYTVTIPPAEGCEYSFDGVTWSENNVKTGVRPDEIVTGYKRYKETGEYNASGAVSDSKQMQKFKVKTPVITPAGGTCTGSVGVTITCASPDAEIYYTTNGSAPTRSSARYTGTFTVTSPATVKAIAIKEGLTDSDIAAASYTKPGSGSSGGGDSGDDDHDSDGGNSGGSGQESGSAGNQTSAAPAASPADTNNPGTGTAPANSGIGSTAGTKPGNDTPQKDREPFIKGENGKNGWDVIRAEEERTKDGNTINVDMNGSTVVPGDIFDSIRGRDITITFDMGNGILWSVDGKSITTVQAGDIDFSVKTGTHTIPVDIINNVTGESYSIQLSLAHEGEFGFTAVLSIGLGRENAGYIASLYYYNESTGELEFICKDKIAEDGTASLTFTHASDYVIMIGEEEENGTAMKPAQQGDAGESVGNDGTAGDNAAFGDNAVDEEGDPAEEDAKDGPEKKTVWPIAAGMIALAAAAIAGVLAWRKKKKEN